jgi:hypothetical protein
MTRFGTILSAAALITAAGFVGGCGHGTYGTYVGAGAPVGYYDYHYYPDSEVYYYPSSSVYYWRDNDRWVNGRTLPSHFHVNNERHVSLRLNTERPFERHDENRRLYPGGRH